MTTKPPIGPPYPTHDFAGSNSDRQSIGLPGHCERCAEVGHVKAHRNLGCGDVECNKDHGPENDLKPVPPSQATAAERAAAAERCYYIVTPGSPWGGKTATLGPFSEAEARVRLNDWMPASFPECPPKLARIIEDYAT